MVSILLVLSTNGLVTTKWSDNYLKKHPVLSIAETVVSYEQLRSMLSSKDIQLFDVRNPDEFQAGRIPGSINIPCE